MKPSAQCRRTMLAGWLFAAPAAIAATIITTTPEGKRWEVTHNNKPLCVYNFAPEMRKPYMQELRTLGGENLLRDKVEDHPHHHGLMYAVIVNGVDFWAETPGSGVQRAVGGITTHAMAEDRRAKASFWQRILWLAEEDRTSDSEAKALMIEDRQLTLTVDEASGEVAVRWRSEFQAGGKTNAIELTGREYLGLGMRFLQELDATATHNIGGKTPDLSGTKQDVSPAAWGAVTFDKPGTPATIAVFGHPDNAHGNPHYFTMARPFAYLSATQRLDRDPLRYNRGDRWTLDYLITIHPEKRGTAFLNERAAEWKKSIKSQER